MPAFVPVVIEQHAENLSSLWNTRRILTRAGDVGLIQLGRIDERIIANQDGCLIAGAQGLRLLLSELATPRPDRLFALVVCALSTPDRASLHRILVSLSELQQCGGGIAAAFGWVEREQLAGIVKDLLASPDPYRRALGLTACRVHGVDPGSPLLAGLNDSSPLVRVEALRTAGTVGRRELVSSLAMWQEEDPDCQFWAAWAAVVLGDRMSALDTLARIGVTPGHRRSLAIRLALQAMSPPVAHVILQSMAGDPVQAHWLPRGSGIAGDPTYVPWLIGHMSNDQTARLAGEAFSLITGADLALLDLERRPPEDFESGPNDNPDDPNVDMDPDDGLPWPDPERIKSWWAKTGVRFESGKRYFMGAPVTREHCIDVLRNGYQRQRILAAHHLCLLEPGTPLFNTSAPAWRQQKLLAQMG